MSSVLIVVDMQNDFVNGALGFDEASSIVPLIAERIKEAKSKNELIIYTLDTHQEDYLETQEGKNLPVSHCIEGSYGHDIVPMLKPLLEGYKEFRKPTFGSLELGNYLSSLENIDRIELCGLVSNICVISNAIIAKAALPESKIVVDSRLTKSFDSKLGSEVFDLLKGIQVEVI